MPPANIQWQDPLMKDVDGLLPTTRTIDDELCLPTCSGTVRRIKSNPETTSPSWTVPCGTSSSDTSPSPERKMTRRRQMKRKGYHTSFLSWFRTINVLLWVLGLVGTICYQRSTRSHLSADSGPNDEASNYVVPNALPDFQFNTTTSLYLNDRTKNRRLRPQTEPFNVPEENDQPIVEEHAIHVVHTRFMQNQPHLVHLGLARLELLKEFTLKSLEMQTSRNFLWVIRTDPDLDTSLRDPLLEALKDVKNHLLIASNENPNVQIHDIISRQPDQVWSGDYEAATKYLQQTWPGNANRKILESRLDADDAFHLQFVEHLQEHALAELPMESSQWKIWCSSRHMEWQYHSVTETMDTSAGVLLSLKDSVCVSAGLTLGYTEGLKVKDLPPIKHQKLSGVLPSCKKQHLKCLGYIQLFPTALRARTPTSAGMLNILMGRKETIDGRYVKGARKQESVQDQLWSVASVRFGLERDGATRLRSYVKDHIREIATDNLLGQCSSGHSCKDSSKVLLQAIIDGPDAFE